MLQQPPDDFIRGYALEVLSDVNDQPHIDKERLFSDAMAFYRWRLSEELAEDSLGVYLHEFRAHHHQVLGHLSMEVRCACFITWFVEQGFHRLPPLTGFDIGDELMRRTRFSSPSFRLPTGEPTETYLVQWVLWSLDHPPLYSQRPEGPIFDGWSRNLLASLPVDDAVRREILPEGDTARYEELMNCARRFFSWARVSLRTWDAFIEYMVAFLYSSDKPGRLETLLNHPCSDALFVLWFVRNNFDRTDKGPRGREVPPTQHS